MVPFQKMSRHYSAAGQGWKNVCPAWTRLARHSSFVDPPKANLEFTAPALLFVDAVALSVEVTRWSIIVTMRFPRTKYDAQ